MMNCALSIKESVVVVHVILLKLMIIQKLWNEHNNPIKVQNHQNTLETILTTVLMRKYFSQNYRNILILFLYQTKILCSPYEIHYMCIQKRLHQVRYTFSLA